MSQHPILGATTPKEPPICMQRSATAELRLLTSDAHTPSMIATSAVPLERERVATLPGRTGRGANEVVGAVSSHAKTAVLATSRGETTALAVLHDRLGDPLHASVVTDLGVGRIHHDHLKPKTWNETSEALKPSPKGVLVMFLLLPFLNSRSRRGK